jgi:hypothetical protein
MRKLIAMPDMDVMPPKPEPIPRPERPPRPDRELRIPPDDIQSIRDEGKRDLNLKSVGPGGGTQAYYNRETETLSVHNSDTGRTETGHFHTNKDSVFPDKPMLGVDWDYGIDRTKYYDRIPPGKYLMLEHGKSHTIRLEPIDRPFGNDRVDATGQTELRIHGPRDDGYAGSIGCITAPQRETWVRVRDTVQSNVHGSVDVARSGLANRILRSGETERLKVYGVLTVF